MNKTLVPSRGNNRTEEVLDTTIHYCLNVLIKIHPPTDEFRKIFTKNMFSKQNTKAFIHVVHYLFNIYDHKEFRKRFYWPICDKNAENAFRTSTVEYVNYLIEQGKLEMVKIQAFIVVMPGGARFMRMLLHIIRFILGEEKRRMATIPSQERHVITKNDMNNIIREHDFWVDLGEKWKSIRNDMDKVKIKIDRIDGFLERLFKDMTIIKDMSLNNFLAFWLKSNEKKFQKAQKQNSKIEEISQGYLNLVDTVEDKLKPKDIRFKIDLDKMKHTISSLECLFPDNAQNFRSIFEENQKLDILHLIQAVHFLVPQIQNKFQGFTCRNIEAIKFEQKEISKVAVRTNKLASEMAMINRANQFNSEMIDIKKDFDEMQENVFRNKYLETPQLSSTLFKGNIDLGTTLTNRNSRLALMEVNNGQINIKRKLLNSTLVQPVPKSPKANRPKPPNSTFLAPISFLNNNNKKTRLDPMSTLSKMSAQGRARSNKANTSMANFSMISDFSMMSTINPEFCSTLLLTPEKQHNRRSINANETLVPKFQSSPNHVASPRCRTIYQDNIKTMSPDSPVATARTKNSNIVKNSPTGRLESLMERREGITPSPLLPKITIAHDESMMKEELNNSHDVSNTIIKLNNLTLDDDDLFNISDGVLKDVDL